MTRISSREFDQDVRRAKREADRAPVIITERGKPAYVLMRHDTYRRITEHQPSIIELLDLPGTEDIDFNPPRVEIVPRTPGLE
jgi:PHD/YefM family antitoxin component YafN of YafNO toxin-antitoxin module